MEMSGPSGQGNQAPGWVCLELAGVELFSQANVKNPGDYRVDTVLRVRMGHQLHARGYLDPYYIRTGLRGLTDDDGEQGGRGEGGERLPVDIFRQDRSELGLAGLMRSSHCRGHGT
jgi:hypothetical protein